MTSRPATGLTPEAQAAAEQGVAINRASSPTGRRVRRSEVSVADPLTSTGTDPGGMKPGEFTPGQRETDGMKPGASGSESGLESGTASMQAPVTSTTSPALTALAGDQPAERHRLNPRVKRYWRWRAFFTAIPSLVLLIGLAIVIPWGPAWLRWGIVAIAAVLVVVGMVVLPPIRYRVFWYAISETEIDIQHKIIFIERSVIPMHRVQALQTERGPLADHYRMTNLKIKTAAGSVSISGLDRDEANELCNRISKLSDIADDV